MKTEQYQKLKDITTDRYNVEMSVIELLPDGLNVGHIDSDCAYLKEDTYNENMKTLSLIRKALGTCELKGYYSCCGLALHYDVGSVIRIQVVMYCTDSEYALERVSAGKCKFETHNAEIKSVVCDLA